MSSIQAFSFPVFDLLSGSYQGSLPFRGVTFSSEVNVPGTFSGVIDLMDPRVQALNPTALVNANKSVIGVDYGGDLLAAYLVQTPDWEVSGSAANTSYTMQVGGVELWGYFRSRVQPTDYSAPPYSGIYVNPTVMPIWDAASVGSTWDPLLIAAQVITDALGYTTRTRGGAPLGIPNGNPLGGITIGYNGTSSASAYLALASGTQRTPSANYINATYPWSSMQTVDTIVTQLANLGYGVGFDYGLDVSYGSGSEPSTGIQGQVNLDYPRRGQTVAQSGRILDLTRCQSYGMPIDGTQQAWAAYEIGGGQAISVNVNVNAGNDNYALFERVFSRAQVTSGNVLNILASLGYTDLYQYSFPPCAPTVTFPLFGDDQNPPALTLGSFSTGDDIELVLPPLAPDGNPFDPRFPLGLFNEWRIIEWQANVPDQGTATLTLTLNPPSVLLPANAPF